MQNKKISVNQINSAIESCNMYGTKTVQINVNGSSQLEIEVKKMIPYDKLCIFINRVVENVFLPDINKNDGTVSYCPEHFHLSFYYQILSLYTNIDVDIDIQILYSLTMCKHIMDKILKVINPSQLDYIKSTINKKIEAKKYFLTQSQSNPLISIVDSMKDAILNLDDMQNYMNSLNPNNSIVNQSNNLLVEKESDSDSNDSSKLVE